MRVAIVFAMLAVAAVASANPIAFDLYVDFDPPNWVHSIYTAPYSTVNAYIVIGPRRHVGAGCVRGVVRR